MQNENLKRYEVKDIPCLLHGRLAKEASPNLFWGGSGIEFTLCASECFLEIYADWQSSEETVRVTVDGYEVARTILMPGVTVLPVFLKLNPEVRRTVRLYKEHQATGQTLRVQAVLTDGHFEEPPKRPFRMEVMGDSLTAAEGLGASANEKDWSTFIFGTRGHYAFLTGEAIDANVRIYALSGWGFVCDWENNPNNVMPRYYEQVAGMLKSEAAVKNGSQEKVDFDAFDADLVCINLGTNDMGAFSNKPWVDPKDGTVYKMESDADGHPTEKALAILLDAVLSTFKTVRKCNPHARILWIFGMCGANEYLANTVNEAIRLFGDANVDFLRVPTMRPETKGAHGHPGPLSHREVADAIIAYLEAKPLVKRDR